MIGFEDRLRVVRSGSTMERGEIPGVVARLWSPPIGVAERERENV